MNTAHILLGYLKYGGPTYSKFQNFVAQQGAVNIKLQLLLWVINLI